MSSNNLDKTFIIKSIEIPSECKIVKTPSIYDCDEDEKINFNDGINFLDKIVSYNNEDIIGKILVGSEDGFILVDKDSGNNFFVTGGTINYLDNLGTLTLSRNDGEDVVIQGLLNNFITGGTLNNNKLFFNNNNSTEFEIDLTEIIFTGISNITEIQNRSYNDLQNLPVIPEDLNQLTDNSNLLFDGDYNSLTNLPILFDGQYSSLSGTPLNLSDFINDSGFITGISNITEISLRDYNDLQNLPSLIENHSELNLDDGTNPHGTTANDVGLGNVDNTSDLNKPISTATQDELDLKANDIDISLVGKSNDYNDLDNLPNLNQATFTIDLIEELTIDIYAPYDLRISSVANIVNTPVTVIQVNDNSYTFNNLINQGDKITITLDVNGVINLNILYE